MSSKKAIPFSLAKAREIADQFGTPIYVYDEQGIRKTAQKLNKNFAWAKGYKNYFAVKALPNPHILKILREEGMGFDCSSGVELEIIESLGISGNDVFFTSNNTQLEDFEKAISMSAVINIDDLTQVDTFIAALKGRSYPYVAVRYNPGSKHSGNDIIGNPPEAKFGMRLDQLEAAFKKLKEENIQDYGLHAMVASNERDPKYFGYTAKLLKEAIQVVEESTDMTVSFVNLGGGFGINYRSTEEELDVDEVAQQVKGELTDSELEILTENGRYVTGPHGYLLTKVDYVMDKHKSFIGVDASMQNLMRPGMYDAYHYITVLGKEDEKSVIKADIVGSLCENNDKFAIDRELPNVEPGDLLVIHDAGAHSHSMGFNYNGKLRSAEVLLETNSNVKLIRRAETTEDYLATIA